MYIYIYILIYIYINIYVSKYEIIQLTSALDCNLVAQIL